MTIRGKIEHYVEHLQELDYIDALLKSVALESLIGSIIEMLQSEQKEHVLAANLFIRDMMTVVHSDTANAFQEGFTTSTIVDVFHKNVFADMYFVRYDTVYTIGKVILNGSLSVLLDAFGHYRERDPLLLPGLLFELNWLGHADMWSLIDQMAHSECDLTRWAVLSTYLFRHLRGAQSAENPGLAQSQMRYLDLFKTDSFHLLRQEADYKRREFDWAQTRSNLSKVERRSAKKVLELTAPTITFDKVPIRFGHHMIQTHMEDYSMADLEAFVLQME